MEQYLSQSDSYTTSEDEEPVTVPLGPKIDDVPPPNDSNNNLHKENDLTSLLQRQIANLQFDDDLIRKNLETSLSTDLNALIRSELNFFQKDKQITITESALIDECLMLLSGLRSNLLFQWDEKAHQFKVNKKLRLINLHKELKDCLKHVCYYSQIVMSLEKFIAECVSDRSNSTQVYETFAYTVTSYLRYYKETLNKIGIKLIKKDDKYTLVDFLIEIRNMYFTNLDIFSSLLKQIHQDVGKPAYAKSINLIVLLHKLLIDSYASQNYAKSHQKFLLWLFIKTLKPFLSWIDTFMHEGVFLDTKSEFGFRRNLNISLDDVEYWKHGFDQLINRDQLASDLPLFMRIILSCAFKICKHMEIITLLGNFNQVSFIYLTFVEKIKQICPYMADVNDDLGLQVITRPSDKKLTIMEINFDKLNQTDKTIIARKSRNNLIAIESLFEQHYMTEERSAENEIKFNMERELENALHECLFKYVDYSSSILIEKMFEKYHVFEFFEFLHSFTLFKSNEIMFVFCKNLFETIKDYETYQEDAILNNLFYKSASSVFTTDILQKKSKYHTNLVTLHFDSSKAGSNPVAVNSSRLVNSIWIKIKIIWPLNIIITKADMNIYNQMFLYILQIKQVKYDLDSLDLKEMDVHKLSPRSDSIAVQKMLLLRFRLMNFMNSAHDLICNQIYECNEEFLLKLRQQKDIDDIVEVHRKFLAKLIKNSLLQHKVFHQSFYKVFDHILDFCDLWRRGIDYFTEATRAYVIELEKNVKHCFDFIYRILSAIINKNHSIYFQSLISALC